MMNHFLETIFLTAHNICFAAQEIINNQRFMVKLRLVQSILGCLNMSIGYILKMLCVTVFFIVRLCRRECHCPKGNSLVKIYMYKQTFGN